MATDPNILQGPWGDTCRLVWGPHAIRSLLLRFYPTDDVPDVEQIPGPELRRHVQEAIARGLPYAEIEKGIRFPNTAIPDSLDSDTGRVRRSFTMHMGKELMFCKIVYSVTTNASDEDPGEIYVVTILPPSTIPESMRRRPL